MSKMFKFFIGVVVLLAIIPLVITMSDNYNIATTEETFVAVQILSVDEVVALTETPVDVTKVTVEGVELTVTTEYKVSGSNVTILATNSETDDVIVVYHTYEMETASAVGILVDLIPLLVIISLVVMGVVAIKLKQ